jgi:hypothetical protein
MTARGYCSPKCADEALSGTIPKYQHVKDENGQRVYFTKGKVQRRKVKPFTDSDIELFSV